MLDNIVKLNVWLKNVNKYFKYQSYSQKKSLIGNAKIYGEFLFVRRLFVDWIIAHQDFYNLKKYQSFKSILKKHIKSLPKESLTIHFIIWLDFQAFLKNHNELLGDIYQDCMCDKSFSKSFNIMVFSMISVDFFYKWRRKRNNSKRSWFGYDNRRKKPSNISMSYFDNIILDEARYYRYYNLHRSNYSNYIEIC